MHQAKRDSHLLGPGHLGQDARDRDLVGVYPVRPHDLQQLRRHHPPPILSRRVDQVGHEPHLHVHP